MKKLLILILMICFALIGCSGGGGGGGSKDKCDGPVPCLDKNWGDQYAVFYDDDVPIVLLADGEFVAVSGPVEEKGEIVFVALGGPASNCYNAILNEGAVDEDLDGIIDYWFDSVSGNLKVCKRKLSVYNIVIEGESQTNVTATFDSMASLSASNHLSTETPISAENVEKVKIRIMLIEQLMEE